MFYYIKGFVSELEPNFAVIDCAGVGYGLSVSTNTLSLLKLNESAKLYVAESIGENNFDLFGFATKGEKRCFEMLTAVSGIGPKAAMSILSYNTPEGLALAIMNEDVKALTVAPGIGKKIAQRVILELKDKLSADLGSPTTKTVAKGVAALPRSGNLAEAAGALMVLGYDKNSVAGALSGLDPKTDVGELIRAALKKLSR